MRDGLQTKCNQEPCLGLCHALAEVGARRVALVLVRIGETWMERATSEACMSVVTGHSVVAGNEGLLIRGAGLVLYKAAHAVGWSLVTSP